METIMDLIEEGAREEFLNSIVEACEKYGFTMGDESWSGNTIYVKIKAGRVGFDIIAEYNEESEEFTNIRYYFDSNIKAYRIDSILTYNEESEIWTVIPFEYKTKDKQDALNIIGTEYDAIIAFDENAFIMYDDECSAEEDTTFNEMEWFTIANRYGEL